jgi:multidrug resistance efflux pump
VKVFSDCAKADVQPTDLNRKQNNQIGFIHIRVLLLESTNIRKRESKAPLRTFRGLKRLDAANVLTLSAALGLLIGSGALWLQFTRVRAREAIVEVRTLTLQSPIEGLITTLEVQAGSGVQKGQSLFQVTNSRVPKPRVGDLQIELSAAQAKLRIIQLQEERAERVLGDADQDFARQSKLQISRQREELNALLRKRLQAQQEASFAERNYARRNQLYKQGAIAFDEVDRAATSLAQAREEVRLSGNRVKAQQQVLEAAQRNLTLIATRGGADPETFLRDSRINVEVVQEEKQAQQFRIQELQNQLNQAKKEYDILRFANITSPIDAVVWTIDQYAGSSVKEQETVLRLLNCGERWVNTYVREGDIKNLYIGQNADIDLYGSKERLRGKISLIRSGIGRSSAGSDIIPLLPINMYRESQVRIALEADSKLSRDPGHLCFSGYTGKVTFRS